MKPHKRAWRWFLFGFLAVLLLSIALLPRWIGDTSRFGALAAAELAAWTGGNVKFVGPVLVRFFPDVSVRGAVEIHDPTRLPLLHSLSSREAKISLDLVDLLRGRVTIDSLRLLKPRIALRDQLPAAAERARTQVAEFLSTAPVRALHIRKGRIQLASGGALKEVYAHFDAGEENGAVSGFGSFAWRDATVRYSLQTGSPTSDGNTDTLPVALTLASKMVRARMKGAASFAEDLKLDGELEAEIGDGRKFVTWLGLPLPEGDSLKEMAAAGSFHFAGSTLTIDDGSFTVDGARAVGLLAVTAASRPRIEGTLAFDRLPLDPYIGTMEKGGVIAAKAGEPGLLLAYVDADLRLSASEVTLGAATFGRAAATLAAGRGHIAGELGELEICGGSAAGRLKLDLSQSPKPVSLVASLRDILIEGCLRPLGIDLPFAGIGMVKADLSGEARSLAELTRGLSGTVEISARDGFVPVDFAKLAATSTPLDTNGWNRDAGTQFQEFDADCRLSAGQISCKTLTMETSSGIVSGSGGVNMTGRSLDWSLSMAPRSNSAGAAQVAGAGTPKISIKGSWLQPVIRRSDRAAFGEGVLPNDPSRPKISPH